MTRPSTRTLVLLLLSVMYVLQFALSGRQLHALLIVAGLVASGLSLAHDRRREHEGADSGRR